MSTPILPLAVWPEGILQARFPANDNALRLEALNREIISQAVTAQPASPTDGDIYIIAATHTGAQWATFTPKDIAIFKGGTWYAWAPVEGLVVNVAGSLFKYDGGAWVTAGSGGGFANPMTTAGDLIVGGVAGAPERIAAGTATFVLTSNGSGVAPTWQAAAGGGGLATITESLTTAAPNATVNVAALRVTGGTTNVDFALGPKGTGALTRQIADSTATGGNKRGAGAVDFQRTRSAAGAVASGADSAVFGLNNTAAGQYSFAFGSGNSAGNDGSVAFGTGHTSSGANSFAAGQGCTASGSSSAAFGLSNIVSGLKGFTAGGQGNTVNSENAIALGGRALSSRGMTNVAVFGYGVFGLGAGQGELHAFSLNTSGATPGFLTSIGGTQSAASQIALEANSAVVVRGQVVARKSNGDSAAWDFVALAKRGASASTTAIVGSTVTPIGADAGVTSYALAIVADTTNGCIAIRGTGAGSDIVYWSGSAIAAYTKA